MYLFVFLLVYLSVSSVGLLVRFVYLFICVFVCSFLSSYACLLASLFLSLLFFVTRTPCCFSRQELEGTLRDPEVAELEVVGRERPYVEACGAAVRRMSADHLARGLKALNQTDIGGSLQVCTAAAVR